jgi:hypothetical protein
MRRALVLSTLLPAMLLGLLGPTSPATAAVPCTNPQYVTTDPYGMWFDHNYVVHNNVWNGSGYDVRQRMAACSFRNWKVLATADNRSGDGAVKSYPNVHKDWHDWNTGAEPRLSSFKGIRSHFASRSPRVGIYNWAYDIWLNGVPGDNEVMIWTDNYRQVPAGSRIVKGLDLGGYRWKVYATQGNHYIAFVPHERITRGTVRIKSMLNWLVRNGRLSRDSTLGQIGYGVEIVSTGGEPRKFKVDEFWIKVRRR